MKRLYCVFIVYSTVGPTPTKPSL